MPSSLPGLALEAVEWLPSGGDTGLVRVRGRWAPGSDVPAGLPALCARGAGEEVERFESLPDATGREPSVWRGAYLAPAQALGGELWLQWESGERTALPSPAGLEAGAAALLEPLPEADEDAGAQVIDRAVMAERRARRAEASERAQARVAAEALRAVEALERRGGELEQRAEALEAERDGLAERLRELESAPAAPAAVAVDPEVQAEHEHRRRALADALGAAARARTQTREWRLLMRTAEIARSSDAVRLRVLEGEQVAVRPLRAELERREAELEVQRRDGEQLTLELARAREQAISAAAALDDTRRDFARRLADEQAAHATDRTQLAGERDALAGAHAETRARLADRETELAETRAELQGVHAELAAARESAGAFESALEAERTARHALGAELESARAEAAAAAAGLRAEAVARAALDAEIDRERAARGALTVALDTHGATLAALEGDLAIERAARASDREALEALRADFSELRSELETARTALSRAESALEQARREEGELLGRIVELDRQAEPEAPDLPQRAAEQEQAAAAQPRDHAESGQLVADLDTAAAALRARVPVREEQAPVEEAVVVEAPVAEPGVVEDVPVSEPPPAELPPRPTIVSARSAPPRGHATGVSQRSYPWLRGALVKLAHDDPRAAGLALAGLLPVQAVLVEGTIDYDLTIAEVGTFSVTVAAGRAYVLALEAPRGRRQAEFHLSGDALSLAEIVAGVPHPIRRFRGPVKIRGRRRRLKPLLAIPGAQLSLVEAARAGARLDPGVVFGTFPYVVHPAWSRGHSFTVGLEVTGDQPETWNVSVGKGAGIQVSKTPPPAGPDATVSMTRETFGLLLGGETAPRGQRPTVRGDRAAVALLKGWLDRAQAPVEDS